MPKPTDIQTQSTPTPDHSETAPQGVQNAEPAKREADQAKNPDEKINAPAVVEFASRYIAKKAKEEPKAAKPEPKGDDAPKKRKVSAVKPAPEPARIDEDKLGKAIGESVAAAIKPKGDSDGKAEDKVDPTEERRFKVMKQMEENHPERYKGHADKFKANMRKLRDYAAKWEKDNPGKEFDESAEEHSEFIDGLESDVEYDDDDYAEALADVRIKEKAPKPDDEKSKKFEDLENRLSEFERKEEIAKSGAKIAKLSADSGNEFWNRLGDDFKGVINTDGTVNLQRLEALKTEDGDRYSLVVKAAMDTEAFAREIFLLNNGLQKYDQSNGVHKFLSDVALEAERKMLERDPEKQLDDGGRQFVAMNDWVKLSDEQKKAHWTFDQEDLAFIVASKIAKDTREHIKADEEAFMRRAKARGMLPEPAKPMPEILKSPVTRHAERMARLRSQRESGEPDDTDGKPVSPSSVMVPRPAPKPVAAVSSTKPGVGSWVQRALRGR